MNLRAQSAYLSPLDIMLLLLIRSVFAGMSIGVATQSNALALVRNVKPDRGARLTASSQHHSDTSRVELSKKEKLQKILDTVNYGKAIDTLKSNFRVVQSLEYSPDSSRIKPVMEKLRPIVVSAAKAAKIADIDPQYEILKIDPEELNNMDFELLFYKLATVFKSSNSDTLFAKESEELNWRLRELEVAIKDIVISITSNKQMKRSAKRDLDNLKSLVSQKFVILNKLTNGHAIPDIENMTHMQIYSRELSSTQHLITRLFEKSNEIREFIAHEEKTEQYYLRLYDLLYEYVNLKDPNHLLIELASTNKGKELVNLADRWLNCY